jgi:uncharacterized protein YvpB
MKLWRSWAEHPRAFVVQLSLGALATLAAAGVMLSFVSPKVQNTLIASQNSRAELLTDIRVSFSLPVSRESFTPVITPETEGRWYWEDPVIAGRLFRTVVFEPTSALQPNTTYTVTLSGIRGVLSSSDGTAHTVSFTTQPLPSIKSIVVGSPHKITEPVVVDLDFPAERVVEYFFSFKPEFEFDVVSAKNQSQFLLTPKAPLQQGVTYELTVDREIIRYDTSLQKVVQRGTREQVVTKQFTTTEPLGIAAVSPQGADVLPDLSKLTVTFAQDVSESALTFLSLEPKTAGSWVLASGQVAEYRFNERLKFETTYKLTVQPGLPSSEGSTIISAGTYSFSTVGPLEIRSIVPTSKSTGVSRSSVITIKFNQAVDKSSVERAVSVSPTITYSKDWKDDATLQLIPAAPLEYSTQYTISIGSSAASRYQKTMRSAVTSTFSTEEKIVTLNVTLDKQDRALSCEAAALKMALAYRGIRVSEDEIMSHIGYDPTTRSGNVWGDPDVAFVGDINGSQNSTGYGVHWAPIAKAASNYRAAKAQTNMTLQDLAREIDAGNPIVVWGTQGRSYYDPWVTPSGKTIPAWKGEHARTVIGYKGNVQSPTAIIVNDPIAGRVTWKAADFDSNWARLSRAGVVVY